MIELTNSVAQTVPAGGTVTFDRVVLKTGCGECCSLNAQNFQSTNSVKLRSNGIYEVQFMGNIASSTAATPVQLAIAVGGTPRPDSVMVATSSAANAFQNVSTSIPVKNCCCDLDRVTVVNTGTVPVLLSANMNLFVKRLA